MDARSEESGFAAIDPKLLSLFTLSEYAGTGADGIWFACFDFLAADGMPK
jgi:hypothetical protein